MGQCSFRRCCCCTPSSSSCCRRCRSEDDDVGSAAADAPSPQAAAATAASRAASSIRRRVPLLRRCAAAEAVLRGRRPEEEDRRRRPTLVLPQSPWAVAVALRRCWCAVVVMALRFLLRTHRCFHAKASLPKTTHEASRATNPIKKKGCTRNQVERGKGELIEGGAVRGNSAQRGVGPTCFEHNKGCDRRSRNIQIASKT